MTATIALFSSFFILLSFGCSAGNAPVQSTYHGRTSSPRSWEEFHARDEARLNSFINDAATEEVELMKHSVSPSTKPAPIASGQQTLHSSNYVVRASFGTPPQSLLMVIDVGNDASWVPCSACVGCPTSANPFDFKTSSTFGPVYCNNPLCNQVYGSSCQNGNTCSFSMSYGGSRFSAGLSLDTLQIGGDDIPAYAFGCINEITGGNKNIPPQGLLGLGRGRASLVSQTKSIYGSTFSYCLPSFRSASFSGSFLLGRHGQPRVRKHTALLTNPRRSSFYYVELVKIKVGHRLVKNIPRSAFQLDATTGGGTIIDSGVTYTRLVAPAYTAVRDEFRRQVGGNVTSLGGFDTCFVNPTNIPVITLKFRGMGMVLPEENTVIRSSYGGVVCLAMAAAPDNVNSVLNIIGNMQQQNYRVVFDVMKSRLGVARESCTDL